MSTSTFLALAAAILLAGVVVRAATGRERGAGAVELAAGMPAPDFTLKASDGRTYTLSQFKGKQAVVIAWFPKAFTGG